MTEQEIHEIWDYYLILDEDLNNTSRYIEPKGQENTYSFEFAKLLILSCTEIETVLRKLGKTLDDKTPGNMKQYKKIILDHFPRIVEAEVCIPRIEENIYPFEGWDSGELIWWNAYTNVKHGIGNSLKEATFIHTCTALSALYILILYMAKNDNVCIESYQSSYIISKYSGGPLIAGPIEELPDFRE